MRRFNPLGLLALLSIIAVLGFLTDNKGWFGFFGFFYYIRYFWVLPDEFFLENVRKTATLAFFRQPAFPHCLRVSLLRIL